MSIAIDYFLSPQSPWTYLGHERFAEIAAKAGATINVLPVDLGRVFPVSGGLPLVEARAAAAGVPAGRAEALQRAPRPAAQPASALLPGRERRRRQAHHRRRLARRQRRGDADRRRDHARRLGRGEEHRRPGGAAVDARGERPAGAARSTTRSRRPCTSATSRTRSGRSTAASSARRPTSPTARCSGARTGSISSSGAWPAADAAPRTSRTCAFASPDAGALGVAGHRVALLGRDLVVGLALVLGGVHAGIGRPAGRLGVGLGLGQRRLGDLDADVLVVAGLVVAAFLGDLVVGLGDLVDGVLARLRRVLVGRLGVALGPGARGLGLGDADVLGVVLQGVAASPWRPRRCSWPTPWRCRRRPCRRRAWPPPAKASGADADGERPARRAENLIVRMGGS